MKTVRNHSTSGEILKKISPNKNRLFALRMAPMIDIIFLLLIFFLVAAKWRPQEDFLPLKLIRLPQARAAIGKVEPLMIYINSTENGCEVRIGPAYKVRIEMEKLNEGLALVAQKLKRCLAEQKRYAGDPLEFICGPNVRWEYTAKIYNLFYGMGLKDITFVMTE